MSALTAFLVGVARHLGTKPPSAPAKAANPSAPCNPTGIAPALLQSLPIQRPDMKTFVRSPLNCPDGALAVPEVDAIDVLFSAAQVQHAAGRLHLKRQRLLEAARYRSVTAEALEMVMADGVRYDAAEVTAEAVVAVLNRLADEADDELAAARDDHAQHDARHRARLERLQPLRAAVGARVAALTCERDRLLARIDAMKRAMAMGIDAPKQRYAGLSRLGLTHVQIMDLDLGEGVGDSEAEVAGMKAHLLSIDAELPPLQAYLNGTQVDMAPLSGLGLFDALIEARLAAEQVPA